MPYPDSGHPEERPAGARLDGRTARLQLPPVIGHRGAAARAPENTLAGLRCAKVLGCSWFEIDVRLTADGVAVLCHDATLDRTTDCRGGIAALPWSAVREADAGRRFGAEFAGERVPSLDEALALAAGLGLAANIEIKAERGREYATAAAVARSLDGLHGGAAVVVWSFLTGAIAAMRELAPGVPRGVLFRIIPRGWAAVAARLGCSVIGTDQRRLSRSRVAAVRAAGYPLAAYTVNDPARARLLFDWGVTSVFSDRPDIIAAAVAGSGPARPVAALRRQAFSGEGAIR